MANETENLNLSLQTLGDVPFKRAYRANMEKLDTVIGDVVGVDTVTGDTIAEKLAALETRVAALEP